MADVKLDIIVSSTKAQKSLNSFGKSFTSSIGNIKNSIFSVQNAIAGVTAFLAGRAVINTIKDLTAAAAVQEDAINSLNSSLKLAGIFSDETSRSIQNFASELQQSTRFGDEVILQNAALIQSLGKLDEDGLKKATTAAVDLAAVLKIDLRSAATLVGKAAAGEIGSFSRYGVIIKKGSDNAETFANTLDALNKKFGGGAAADVKTYSGRIDQLSNSYGDLQEELGFSITQSSQIAEVIGVLSDVFKTLGKLVSENRKFISDLVAKAMLGLLNIIPSIIRGVGYIVTAFDKVNEVIDYVISRFSLLGRAASTITTNIKSMFGFSKETKNFQDEIKEVNQILSDMKKESSNQELVDFLDDAAKKTQDVIDGIAKLDKEGPKAFSDTGSSIKNKLNPQLEKTKEQIDNIQEAADGLLKLDFSQFLLGISKGVKLGNIFSEGNKGEPSLVGNFRDAIGKAFDGMTVEDLGKFAGAITSVVGAAFSTAASIIEGVFNFGISLLSGQFVNQIADFIEGISKFPEQFIAAFERLDSVLIGFVNSLFDQQIEVKDPETGEVTIETKEGLFDQLTDRLPDIFSSIFEKIPDFAASFAEVIGNLAGIVKDLIPGFVKAVDESADIIVTSILSAVITVVKALADALPEIIRTASRQFLNFLDFITELGDVISEAIGPVFQSFLKELPNVLIGFFDTLDSLATDIAIGLVGAIEAILLNIDQVIGAIVEGLVSSASAIVEALITSLIEEGGLERITIALVKAGPRIGSAIAVGLIRGSIRSFTRLGEASVAVIENRSKNIGNIIAGSFSEEVTRWTTDNWPDTLRKGFIASLNDLPTPDLEVNLSFKKPAWVVAFQDALNNFSNAAKSQGGSILERVGLASGGIIPPGYEGDTFPALLSSGETVVPRETSNNLFELIDRMANSQGSGGNQNINVTLQVGEQDLANVMLNLNRRGFRTA